MCAKCGIENSVRLLRNVEAVVKRQSDGSLVMCSGISRHSLPDQYPRDLAYGEQRWGFRSVRVCDPNTGCGRILTARIGSA